MVLPALRLRWVLSLMSLTSTNRTQQDAKGRILSAKLLKAIRDFRLAQPNEGGNRIEASRDGDSGR